MKKILAALTVVSMLTITSQAIAKGPKPPKSICLGVDGYTPTFALTTSKGGTVVVADKEKIQHYNIQGFMHQFAGSNFPAHGSGYVKGDIFTFTLTTMLVHGDVTTINLFGKWNLLTETGTAWVSENRLTVNYQFIGKTLYLLDCNEFSVPSETETDEPIFDDREVSPAQ
jgi:hypothetical protein